MRRLPIYFLIDISESMVGEPIEQVQEGIASIIKELKTDPQALETVWVSIIGFAGKSKIITPLQDIITFYPPKIPIGSGTSLSAGLSSLMSSIQKDVIKTTFEKKGDWKPIIFLFTDGAPTNDTTREIAQWNQDYRSKTNMVAISIGENSNYNLLGELTDNVLQFNNSDANAYKTFFKWVTASIKLTSENVVNNHIEGINLSKTNADAIEKIDLSKPHSMPDENVVVINGRCSETEKSYLMKFKKDSVDSGIGDFRTRIYKIDAAYKIDELSYQELSSEQNIPLKISASELYGNPHCPHCGNHSALATCSCGGIHCVGGEGEATCPWCGSTAHYGFSSGDFDINRTLG